jgi:transposase-like protein
MPACPRCESTQVIKNGRIHSGKPKWQCKACGRQFVETPQWRTISDDTKALIDRLLLEKISIAGIARATNVSESWLYASVSTKYAQVPRQLEVTPKKSGA